MGKLKLTTKELSLATDMFNKFERGEITRIDLMYSLQYRGIAIGTFKRDLENEENGTASTLSVFTNTAGNYLTSRVKEYTIPSSE